MVMKAQTVMQLKLHTFFIFSLNEDMRSASGSKGTARSKIGWATKTVTTW